MMDMDTGRRTPEAKITIGIAQLSFSAVLKTTTVMNKVMLSFHKIPSYRLKAIY